ncbi:hypothetical protein BDQ12DRAFT_566334, partial [Crucibulum laeve]
RTIWDIFWSSIVTIFLCTWVAIHPNIPAATDPWRLIMLRKARLCIYAVIVPELIIYWAMRQWIVARTISQRYRDQGWTKTHAFFIQMGGFMLYEDNSPVRILSITEFEELLQKNEIEFPDILEQEIEDKSKGDMLSKGIVVLQTAWFIIQCIARASQSLAITELELVALSFCVLNGLMYYLWWDKPLDVHCTVPVHKKTIRAPGAPTRRLNPSVSPSEQPAPPIMYFGWFLEVRRELLTLLSPKKLWDKIPLNLMHIWILPWEMIKWVAVSLATIIVLVCGSIVAVATYPIYSYFQLSGLDDDTNIIQPNAMRVPEFYAYHYQTDDHYLTRLTRIIPSAAAIVFGGIHCIAWSFHFPSDTDQLLWRASACIITGTSVLVTVIATGNEPAVQDCAALVMYAPARISLLVVALRCLGDLPDGAYQTVQWTRFLPHF